MWVSALLIVGVSGCTSGSGTAGPAPTAARAAPDPVAPTLAADFARFAKTSGYAALTPGSRRLDPRVARLQGPHFAYEVTAVGSLRGVLPGGLSRALGMEAAAAPAAGQQLLLIDVTRSRDVPVYVEVGGSVIFEVAAGPVGRRARMAAPVEDRDQTLAVSLPVGARPVLRVVDAGRAQTLDLASGRRGGDAIAGYYPRREGEWKGRAGGTTGLQLSGPGVAGLDDRRVGVEMAATYASLNPYFSGRGWARPGRAWLAVETSVAYVRPAARSAPRADTVTVPAACFQASGPDGERLPLSGDPMTFGGAPEETSDAGGEGVFVADVPAALSEVTVVFRFCGSIRTNRGPVTYRAYTTPTQTARIALGAP